MKIYGFVALGGALGACTRYGFTVLLQKIGLQATLGILLVNLFGCLLMGVLTALLWQPSGLRYFLLTGFLGGFTTYASYAFDLVMLSQKSSILALAYLFGHLLGGVGCVLLGLTLGKFL